MSDSELQEKILSIPSESKEIEFKRLGVRGQDSKVVSKVCQTIVAMANTNGGTIILGVNDPEDTDLKGEERIFGIEENMYNYNEIGHNIPKISPGLQPEFQPVRATNGKTIMLIKVKKAEEGFHQYSNEVFMRLERGNRKLTTHEIETLSYSKGFKTVDGELMAIDIDLLETEHYKEWRDKEIPEKHRGDIRDILKSKGLARKNENGVLQPTRAAVMLFAEYPTNLMETKCAIKVMVYDKNKEVFGETPNVTKTEIIEGAIIKLIRETHKYVLEQLKSGLTIKSGFEPLYKIPERAVKEAITNAIIHRDYHAKCDIEIKIFKNRIEILNAGLFPSNITLQNIGIMKPVKWRNDILVKILRKWPSRPNLDSNEGIKAMRAEMDSHNLYQPIFKTCSLQHEQIPDSIRLTLWNKEISPEWKKIKTYLEKNKYIDNKTARKVINVGRTPDTSYSTSDMSHLLKEWVDIGILIRIAKTPKAKKDVLYKMSKTGDLTEF